MDHTCLVVASGVPISQVFWINSTLRLTLDTEYVTVTQYNGTAVTSTTVVTGDVDTIDPATVSAAYSMALTIPMPDPYGGLGGPGVVLANGRDGKLNDAVSIPYPSPYLGIAGVQVWTQTLLSQTIQGSVVHDCPLKTFNIFEGGYADDSLSCIQVEFSNTYYEALTDLSGQPWSSTVVEIDTASFSSWVMSNETFVKQYPGLSHCTFIPPAFGPPGVKIPVSALTGTITTTVQGSMYSSPQLPQPASTLVSTTAQQTTGPLPSYSSEMLPSIQYQSSAASSESENPESSAQISQNSPQSTLSVATSIDYTQSTSETPTSVILSSYVQTQVTSSSSESSTLQPDDTSAIVVAGQTLSQQVSAIIEGSTPISLAGGGGATILGSSAIGQAEQSSVTMLQVPVLTYGGSPKTADASSRFILSDQTLVPGSAITISGTLVSLAAGASSVVVGGNVEQLTDTEIVPSAVRTTGGPVYQIAGQTLTPGGTVTVSGTPIHIPLGSSVAIIGSSTHVLAAATPTAIVPTTTYQELSFGDQTYTASGSTPEFIIASQTLTPNGAVTVSGTPIRLPSGASVAIVGSSTQSLAPIIASNPDNVATAKEITFGGKTYTASGSTPAFIIAGQTLTPNGAITVAGTPIRLQSGASVAVVGTSTQSLAPTTAPSPENVVTAEEMTFGGKTYTASGSTPEFIVAGQTLTPNGAITVSGTPLRIPSGASVVIVGSSTQSLATVIATNPANAATIADITFGGQTYTAGSASQFKIGGQTLSPGGVVTVDGTQISYASAATDIVVGSSTEPANLGTVIMGGFGQPSQSGSEPFTGASSSNARPSVRYWIGLAMHIRDHADDQRKIDVHTHFLTPTYRAALLHNGHQHLDGMPAVPEWSAEAHLAFMEANGIEKSILSRCTPSPGVSPDARENQLLARESNDYAANLKASNPSRFGYFAFLPLPDIQASLEEIEYVFSGPAPADGIMLLSNNGGHYLGDPYLRPILEALNNRRALVFVHPVSPCPPAHSATYATPYERYTVSAPLASVYPAPIFEFFFDSARSFIDLIMSGTARRFPHIKWIVTHCGGVLPSLIDRMVLFVDYFGGPFREFRNGGEIGRDDVERVVREQFWFDLAGNPVPNLVDALLRFSSKERLLFGSDTPFTPFEAAGRVVRHLEEGLRKKFGEEDLRMIWRENALRLLREERISEHEKGCEF
ncbi:MAG: hypothetical protein Q9195_005253 [Heterodermia aff. obscurata]